ncbi:MAG: hypothetical protein R3E75_08150 [Steroidobacteraceae bacterium]|nr:hypothetical protein [Nevskiaceae bacterium]MCP5359885.1 hypothetical protein [Nevskiaceae bacterium]MCP5472295.1 hypothetical protein [Nevskiaceae bacterium]
MTDDELHRHAEELAQQFESRGFIVTRRLEVEAAGLAAHLGISEKTLRNWRAEEFGPPSSRTVRRVALYPIADLAKWKCAQLAGRSVLARDGAARSESAPGGTQP